LLQFLDKLAHKENEQVLNELTGSNVMDIDEIVADKSDGTERD
jgi:hypothetical protein